jgi:alanyl-tRNA synthetase
LRFDFAHNKPVSQQELDTIENLVNGQVLNNTLLGTKVMSIAAAQDLGAMALFGEKYGDVVRVISIENNNINNEHEVFSIELCGGTHVVRTGDIGLFCIVQESGIAAGVRRIEAVTGQGALARVRAQGTRLHTILGVLKASPDNVEDKVQQMFAANKALEKEVQLLKVKVAVAASATLAQQAQIIKGFKVLAVEVHGMDGKTLREAAEQLRDKLGSGVVVLAVTDSGKVSLVVAVSHDLVDRVKAGELVNTLALQVGGKGGGRADIAMAGGTNAAGLSQALSSVAGIVANYL